MALLEAQLATLVDAPPRGERWVFEIKYDGYRAIASKRGSVVEMVSRRGLRYAHFGAIEKRLARLPCRSVVLDGEVCVLDEQGRPRFEALQAALTAGAQSAFVYFVFDVLSLDGRDLREAPLTERKKVLAKLVRSTDTGLVRRVVTQTGDGDAFLEAARSLGLEGILAKRADRPYRAGRSLDWQKVKAVAQQELVIVGYTPPSGSRLGLGALLLGVNENGALRYAGKVGSGFGQEMLHTLSQRLRPLEVDRAPVVDAPRIPRARWVRPTLVAEVRFGEWTRDGRLRHPVFLGLRTDKKPADVVRETPSTAKERLRARVA